MAATSWAALNWPITLECGPATLVRGLGAAGFGAHGHRAMNWPLKLSHDFQMCTSGAGSSGIDSSAHGSVPSRHRYGLFVSGWIVGGSTSWTGPARSSNSVTGFSVGVRRGHASLCMPGWKPSGRRNSALSRPSLPTMRGAPANRVSRSNPSSARQSRKYSTWSTSIAHVPLAECTKPRPLSGLDWHAISAFSGVSITSPGLFHLSSLGPLVPRGMEHKPHPSRM